MTVRSPFQGRSCPPLKSSVAATQLHLDAPAGADPGDARGAAAAIWAELHTAAIEYPQPWASAEEGAMLLREELDELWDEVRRNRIPEARTEAVQVAAMALRFITDVAPASPTVAWVNSWMNSWPHHDCVGPRRPFSSAHEAFGFLLREYDALWANVLTGADATVPATRVAMMAARFITDVTGPTLPTSARGPR